MFLVKNRRKRIKTIKVHQHHANKVPKKMLDDKNNLPSNSILYIAFLSSLTRTTTSSFVIPDKAIRIVFSESGTT